MQPRKSVYRVYSSSRALREHLKSCSRRDGSTSNGRIDHVFQIWLPPALLPSHSPCRDSSPRTFPVRPPGGRRSIPNRSIRALRVTSGRWPRHEIFYVTGRARANLSNNKMDSHVSPSPPPPTACMLRVKLTSENLIRHGEKNRPISGLQIVGIFFFWDRKK